MLYYCTPAASIEHYPSIPIIDGSQSVVVLSASGLCQDLANYIESKNQGVHFVTDDGDWLLMVLRGPLPVLKRRYSSISDIKIEAQPRLQGECKEIDLNQRLRGTNNQPFVYLYKRRKDGTLYRAFTSVPSCVSSGGPQMACIEFQLSPGYIAVQFSLGYETIGPTQLYESYQIFSQIVTVPDGHEEEAAHEYYVGVGTEEAWVKILSKLPYIDEVSRVDARFAAVDSNGSIGRSLSSNDLPRVSLYSIKNGLSENWVLKAVTFFQNKYVQHAEIKVLSKSEKRVILQITGLRGEVLPSQGYWETLLVDCVFSADAERVDFFLSTTGRYAHGVGPLRPSDSDFTDMDREYYETLQHYSDGLATELQTALGG
jgi:hypothetical protein